MLLTSEQWQKKTQEKYPGFYVMDADGWDRSNYQYSWHEELITQEEFETRASASTCCWDNQMIRDIITGNYSLEIKNATV